MAKFEFKVAYTTNPDNIEQALSKGIIDEGDLIVVNQNGVGTLRFINKDRSILSFSSEVDADQLQTAIDNTIDVTLDDKIDTTVDEKVNAAVTTEIKPIVDSTVQEAINNLDIPSGNWTEF